MENTSLEASLGKWLRQYFETDRDGKMFVEINDDDLVVNVGYSNLIRITKEGIDLTVMGSPVLALNVKDLDYIKKTFETISTLAEYEANQKEDSNDESPKDEEGTENV